MSGVYARPLFSVIIPTLNAGATLRNAIDSVLTQKYPELEVIVVDGKSTDDTIEIVQGYSNSRIKLVYQTGKGIYDAMNQGIETASGNWLYFLGSDDTLYDDRVLEDVSYFIAEEQSPDIVYGNVHSSLLGDNYDGAFDREKILKRNICHQAIFYGRNVFDKIGYYNVEYAYCADYDLNVRCLYNPTLRIVHIPRRIAVYHSEGMSSDLIRFYDREREEEEQVDANIFRQALIERYLMLKTMRQVGVGDDYVQRGMEKQAKRLLRMVGYGAALLGTANKTLREFARYDRDLPRRMRKLAWKSLRGKLRKGL